MKNDPEKYSVQCPNCAAEHCFPTRKAVAVFTKDWKSPRFESLCRKNRKLILLALTHAEKYSERELAVREEYRAAAITKLGIKYLTLRAQLLEAK